MNDDTPSNDITPTTASEAPVPGPGQVDEQSNADDDLKLQEVEAEPDSKAGQSDVSEPATPLPDPKPITIASPRQVGSGSSKKRRIILFGAAGAIAVAAAVVTWFILAGNKQSDEVLTSNQSSTSEIKKQPRLGVAVTVADGTVTYQKAKDVQTSPAAGDGPWNTVTADTELSEGDQVRTGNGSRAVLTLDDGSAVRLDANSTVTLTSLVASDIKITQLAGTVYSRVVASERKYSVDVTDTSYEALGTAFITVKKAGENGVQVYQSSVKADGQTVAEGKQYYSMNTNTDLQGKVTDINIDTLIDNEFITWNLTEDEKDAKFKDKLGLLPAIKQRADEKKTEEQEKAAAERAEKDRKALEEKKKKEQNVSKEKVTRGTMNLTVSGETFNWSYTGKAVHGYKLVWSNTNPNPHFTTDKSIYFSGINQLTGTLPGPEKTGRGTFYIRVCAYTAGTETEPCVDYSQVQSFTRQ